MVLKKWIYCFIEELTLKIKIAEKYYFMIIKTIILTIVELIIDNLLVFKVYWALIL